MKIFCDMDMVLVKQTGPIGFDRMPWMPDGHELWDAIKAARPILLTQVRVEAFGQIAKEKLSWIDRELGSAVPVIFTPDTRGKGPFAAAGHVLIDDAQKHGDAWALRGGTFVLHRASVDTIRRLRSLRAI